MQTKQCSTERRSNICKAGGGQLPINLFYKDPDHPAGTEYDSCFDCRAHVLAKLHNRQKIIDEQNKKTNFKRCSGSYHLRVSEHDRNQVPKDLFIKDGKETATCIDCRNSEAAFTLDNKVEAKEQGKFYCGDCRTIKDLEEIGFNSHGKTLLTCQDCKNKSDVKRLELNILAESKNMHCCSSCNKIKPYEEMNTNIDGTPAKCCIKCRDNSRVWAKNEKENILELRKVYDETKSEFWVCNGNNHNRYSNYPRDKVPKIMFETYNGMCESCEDCRKGLQNEHQIRKEYAESIGKNYCGECRTIKFDEEMGINLNGDKSNQCKKCKIASHDRSMGISKEKQDIKLNIMLKMKSCCEICNVIFLKNPDPNSIAPIIIHPYQAKEETFVDYEDCSYELDYFFTKYGHLIDCRLTDYDHLPESEQIARGKSYAPKNHPVNKAGTIKRILTEIDKTQLICHLCHVYVTEKRHMLQFPGSNKRDHLSLLVKEKLEYINNDKKRGCSSCTYKNDNCPKFFEYDHLIPGDKLCCISSMVLTSCSLEELKVELNKCRLLCAYCHKIHTDKQTKERIAFKERNYILPEKNFELDSNGKKIIRQAVLNNKNNNLKLLDNIISRINSKTIEKEINRKPKIILNFDKYVTN